MNKRIALTGATGFVGKHLLKELLSQGHLINALTRRSQPPQDNVNWIMGDLKNKPALKELVSGVDVIINVAGLVKANSKNKFLAANATAVSTLLEQINSNKKTPHFIQISSLSAREPQISDYAFSKYQGEENLKNNSISLNWTMVRPPGIYGPEDTETLKIFKMLKWHLALFPASRHNRVSWVHVSDLVKAISLLIVNKKYFGKIINVDDGREDGYSHEEFMATASELLNIKPLKITIPKFILKVIGHINDTVGRILGYSPMVSAKKVNELCHSNWICDKKSSFKDDEYKTKFNLKDGLKQTLDWYKSNEYI
ncbi:MAG: NAD-dependent epimerase/dehydratase family protein [Emcibacteraceae bacterium]|nr:NAD-dependent epimerase/dehydratase family protein [Emcibacteraceae bacterium]